MASLLSNTLRLLEASIRRSNLYWLSTGQACAYRNWSVKSQMHLKPDPLHHHQQPLSTGDILWQQNYFCLLSCRQQRRTISSFSSFHIGQEKCLETPVFISNTTNGRRASPEMPSSRSFHMVTCCGSEMRALVKDRRMLEDSISLPLSKQVRWKSKKKQVDSDDESGSDEDDNLDEDDFEAPEKFRVSKIHTASLRADAVISAALNISRQRLEEVFFGSGLLLNGQKMLKKSAKMDEGDYVDLVLEKADDQYKVKRVKIIRVYPEKTTTGKSLIKVRLWKAPFFIAAPDNRPS